jgi:signal transduction histidine kinase
MSEQVARLADLENRIGALESQLHVQTERVRSIQEISVALGSTLDLDQLLVLIMDEVTRLMDAERSTLFLCDEERRELWSKIAQEAAVHEIRLCYGEGLAGHVAVTGETVNIPDAYGDSRFQPDWDRLTGFRTRSVLAEPLWNKRGETIGVIQVLNKRSGTFSADDESLLAALCAQAAISLENSKLYQSVVAKNQELVATYRELGRRVRELEFLFEIEREINRATDLDAAIELTIRRTAEVLGAEAGSILLAGERGGDLYFRHAAGLRSEVIRRFRLPLGQGIAGWVAREGLPVVSNDPSRDPRHRWPIAEAIDFPARSILCVPLTADDRVLGAFELLNKRGGTFGDDDLKLATLVAGLISMTLQEARHRAAAEKATRLADLGQLLSGIIHDFRTPMTIISGYAQLMAQDRPREEREEGCATTLRQIEHMNAMTKEILAFARGESSVLFRRVHVNKFFGELEELLAPEFSGRGIDFRLDLRYRGPARFDEAKIRRAIHNVARNAMEATPEGGSFAIVVDRADDDLLVTLSDTGSGIPEEIRDSIFESFVSRGKSQGTGLGLAIVKKIIDEHHGEIRFETAEGRGTTFTLRIPMEADAPEAGGT